MAIREKNYRFTENDQMIVRKAMALLTPREFKVVFLRFWSSFSLLEIARELRTNFDNIDLILSEALLKLKNTCIHTPGFCYQNKSRFIA